MALSLGLDIGTQGAKAVVYDTTSRRIVGRGAAAYDIIKSDVPGRAEQAPSTWLAAGTAAARQALSGLPAGKVAAVGVSGQQHGFVPLDRSGRVLRNAKLWCDMETAAEAAELSHKFGYTMVPSFTASKILWLQRHEPEVYERLAMVMLPHDYVNYWLTGRHAMEHGDASGTGVYDPTHRRWDRSAMDAIDPRLASCFPDRLMGPNEAVGTLTQEAAEALGLSPQVVVSPGSGDNACSALGAGVVDDGQLVISLGTSGTLFGKSSRPIVDRSGAIAAFCDATGAWLPLVCTLNCTRPPEEVREAFGLQREAITALAAAEAPGCSGLNFLPYIAGERTPNWPGASGVLAGIRPGSLRPGSLYRAALEGATFSLQAGLHRMKGFGLVPRDIRLVGGGSKNPLWRQIVADALQLPLQLPLEPEAAALGAALQAAAVQAGADVADYVRAHPPQMNGQPVEPDASTANAYAEAFERHVQMGLTLFEGGKNGSSRQ